MSVYYNENDACAAVWLRELMIEGLIAPGVIDDRSIDDVAPSDLDGFTQCHFFAGIGGWPYALRLAGWPDTMPVWTGSCPCQPFSTAGARAGFDDRRHLWPTWNLLITERKPVVIFGEQVAKRAGLGWLDLVRSDLVTQGYRVGHAVLAAAGIGAPHIRDRLYWVADRAGAGLEVQRPRPQRQQPATERGGAACELVDAGSEGSRRHGGADAPPQGDARLEVRGVGDEFESAGEACELGDAGGERCEEQPQQHLPAQSGGEQQAPRRADPDGHGGWSDPDWVWCRDSKWRPVEPGTFPLADGLSGRVGLLRGYGNAIVPPLAAAFVKAYATL